MSNKYMYVLTKGVYHETLFVRFQFGE